MSKYNKKILLSALSVMLGVALASCAKKPAPASSAPGATAATAANASAADAQLEAAFNAGKLQDMFDLRLHPGATITAPIDPHTLTPTQVKFGIAPKRDPSVEYQPNVIVMEQGDKAIKSIAGDGMSWTFDANAPQVSDFQEDKIVFATGRAVGRVLALKKDGDSVTVILGPVTLGEIIKNGNFAYDGPIALDSVIAYSAPDYPEPPPADATKTSDLYAPPIMHMDDAGAGRLLKAQLLTTPQIPTQYVQDVNAVQSVDIQDMTSSVYATSGGVGMQLKYNQNGLSVKTRAEISIRNSGLSFFLSFKNGLPDVFGLQLKGAAGVMLAMDASAAQNFQVNIHKTLYIPIDLSIPLGGPVPLSLTFAQSFSISTGFSARTSVLNAKGDYGFSGGVVAGCWHGSCRASVPAEVHANADLGNTVLGVSVGINSLVLGSSIRAMAGLGGFGFATGVYGGLRFTGTILRAADIAFPCRQGTIDSYIDSGVGYAMPQWVATAINIFLKPFTKKRVDAIGSFVKGPSLKLFSGITQIPGHCASPNGGGGTSAQLVTSPYRNEPWLGLLDVSVYG
ncbi:MAG TPA: hypothetical protein VGI90_01000 [Steroidobacteraceae bacterium]|jgi:hypothetical protein